MNKLICMGDCVIDFLPSAPKSLTYTAKMGGAPANVCVAVAKLGAPAYYLGKLAADNFGAFLSSEMRSNGVCTDAVVIDKNFKSGLVFIDQYENGDREFFCYREDAADANLHPEEVDENLFEKGDILHFCSISLAKSPTKHAHERAIKIAKEKGVTVSFDVNARYNFWRDINELKKTIIDFLPCADFVKVTDDELAFITSESDEKKAARMLFEIAQDAKLLFVTKGSKGSTVYDRDLKNLNYPAKGDVVVDTTGAGDCYVGSIIYKLLKNEAALTLQGIADAAEFAVAACAYVISEKGAAAAMPTLDKVNALLNKKA